MKNTGKPAEIYDILQAVSPADKCDAVESNRHPRCGRCDVMSESTDLTFLQLWAYRVIFLTVMSYLVSLIVPNTDVDSDPTAEDKWWTCDTSTEFKSFDKRNRKETKVLRIGSSNGLKDNFDSGVESLSPSESDDEGGLTFCARVCQTEESIRQLDAFSVIRGIEELDCHVSSYHNDFHLREICQNRKTLLTPRLDRKRCPETCLRKEDFKHEMDKNTRYRVPDSLCPSILFGER